MLQASGIYIIKDGAELAIKPDRKGATQFTPISNLHKIVDSIDQEDPVRIFKTATEERLSKNGITVTDDKDNAVSIDILVRQFKLDFNLGKWSGEVGYLAKLKKNGEVICERSIYEKASAFNLYGFGSGEKAINEAFNKAINSLDINSCFSKLQE